MRTARALLIAAAILTAACGAEEHRSEAGRTKTTARTPRPTECREVSPGDSLGRLLESATDGDVYCLTPGHYPGPLTLSAGITLWGPRDAVIRSSGEGTTVTLAGDRGALLGVTVDGSGGRFETLDAAVLVRGRETRVEGVKIVNAVFGILVERTSKVTIRANEVHGNPGSPLGLRGDAIRLWETQHSLVEANRVEDSRDLVVWYSSDNLVRDNVVRRGRYGTHFMYSHRNRVEDNRYLENEVGIFAMYSHALVLERNLLAGATGASGMGLGLKESGDVRARENLILHNTSGLYLDQSPLQQNEVNHFERNVIRLGEVGVTFHSSEKRNHFLGNSFRDNHAQVRVEGSGDALAVEWRGNDFDDYAGYDLDGDGRGDLPYELRSLSGDLVDRYPELAFFRGSAALALVSVAGDVLPLLAPRTLLRDPEPRMEALELPLLSEVSVAD